jgi:hypothetical protein
MSRKNLRAPPRRTFGEEIQSRTPVVPREERQERLEAVRRLGAPFRSIQGRLKIQKHPPEFIESVFFVTVNTNISRRMAFPGWEQSFRSTAAYLEYDDNVLYDALNNMTGIDINVPKKDRTVKAEVEIGPKNGMIHMHIIYIVTHNKEDRLQIDKLRLNENMLNLMDMEMASFIRGRGEGRLYIHLNGYNGNLTAEQALTRYINKGKVQMIDPYTFYLLGAKKR